MRMFVVSGLTLLGVALAAAVPAVAYENFIPMGTGYSTEIDSLPRFDSDDSTVRRKADVYETELYHFGRNAAEADSYFRRFQSDAEISGGDTSIDY